MMGGVLSPKKLIETTDSTYNLRIRVYQLNKLVIITIYSIDMEPLPLGEMNYELVSGIPEPFEHFTVSLFTNYNGSDRRSNVFNVTTSGNRLFISYVYNFVDQPPNQIAQQIVYISK